MWRGVGLILLCLLTFVLGLGQSAITDSDEAFYAEAGREMVASGDWITPHYNFEPRLQKPILFYWLVAATYTVAGINEFSARLWSGLAGVGLALLSAAVARRWIGPNEGLIAGAIVATSFGVVPLARQSLPDMPLAFFVTLTIWAAIESTRARTDGVTARRWIYLSSAAAALGMLDKGPVAIVLPVTVLVPLLWHRWRQDRATWLPVGPRDLLIAALIFIAIAAPWYMAVMRAQGLDYARRFFIGENVERFATSTYNSWRPWIYIGVILGGLLPWSAFFLLWIRPLREWVARRRLLTDVEMRLVAWAVGPLVFFLLSVGSQPRYILPVLPPLAILLARSIWRHATGPARHRGTFTAATFLAAGMMLALSGLLWRTSGVLAAAGAAASSGPVVMLVIAAVTCLALVMASPRAVPATIALASAVLLVVYQGSVLRPGRPEPVERVAEVVRQVAPTASLCACGALGRSLSFYTHARAQIANVTADDQNEMEQFFDTPDRVLAVTDGKALSGLEAKLGRTFPRLAEVTYLNTFLWQGGKALQRPDPEWVQHVILIANR